MSAALGSVVTIFLGIFSRIKAKIKIIDLNNQLGNANHTIDLLNKSIATYEQKADKNVPPATAKADQSSSLE